MTTAENETKPLKAYRVEGEHWSLVHAESAGQAKYLDILWFEPDSTPMMDAMKARRVRRMPNCDQFADYKGIDDAPEHEILAGLTIRCWRCDEEIQPGDRWVNTYPFTVLCGNCFDIWEREG